MEEEKPKYEYPQDVAPLLNTLQSALKNTEDKDLADDVVNFLMIQFNPSTRRAWIDFVTYKLTLMNSVKGLHRVIFITHYPKSGRKAEAPIDISRHKAVFYAAMNLTFFLFSKLLDGKEYNLDLAEINAKKRDDIHVVGRA